MSKPIDPEKLRRMRKKKPRFLNVGRYLHGKGLLSWRRPRGIDSKQRIKKKGQPKMPSVGYKENRKIRGLHPSGRIPKVVYSIRELEEIPEEERGKYIIYIGGTVGRRKRMILAQKIEEMGFVLANKPREVAS